MISPIDGANIPDHLSKRAAEEIRKVVRGEAPMTVPSQGGTILCIDPHSHAATEEYRRGYDLIDWSK